MPSLGHITRCRGEVREVLLSILYASNFYLSTVLSPNVEILWKKALQQLFSSRKSIHLRSVHPEKRSTIIDTPKPPVV